MKKLALPLLAVFILGINFSNVNAQPTPPSGQQWQLVFNEDFNTWNSDEWGRGSTPWGTENQSSCTLIPPGNTDAWVSGGNLVLRSRAGNFTAPSGNTFPYTSGWAWMKNWRTYGYIEIHASFPDHYAAWPAFWMLGDGWPPEFDIAEYRGAPRNYMTRAFYNGTWYSNTMGGDYTGWNTYGLEWLPNRLRWYVNGNLRYEWNGTTPSEPMYVILSNGVDCADANGQGLPSNFLIDYVRWYQLSGSGGGGITSGQTYRINVRDGGRALDANGTANNSSVQVYDYWGGANQRWTVTSTSGGYYRLTNIASGRALDAGGTANNSPVQIYDYWGGNNQQWAINDLGNDYYSITNRSSGRVLDVGGTANGSPVQIYDYWGGQNQQFQFTVVGLGSRVAGDGSGSRAGRDQKGDLEQVVTEEILLFPNPVDDFLNLTLPEKYGESADIEIYDVTGHIVKKKYNLESASQKIDLKNLGQGVYFVRITDGADVISRKFIKK